MWLFDQYPSSSFYYKLHKKETMTFFSDFLPLIQGLMNKGSP